MAPTISRGRSTPLSPRVYLPGSRQVAYTILGAQDETEVESLLILTCPAIFQNLALDSISAEPLGGGAWQAWARYMSDNEVSEDLRSLPDVFPDVERLEVGCETVNREPFGDCPPGTVRLGKWPNADGSYTLSIWYRPEGWSVDFLGIE